MTSTTYEPHTSSMLIPSHLHVWYKDNDMLRIRQLHANHSLSSYGKGMSNMCQSTEQQLTMPAPRRIHEPRTTLAFDPSYRSLFLVNT